MGYESAAGRRWTISDDSGQRTRGLTAITLENWGLVRTVLDGAGQVCSRGTCCNMVLGDREQPAGIFINSKTARLQLGRDHGHGKFRHRRIGLAATRQLGPDEEVPDRACARAHEEARPR